MVLDEHNHKGSSNEAKGDHNHDHKGSMSHNNNKP